MKRLAMTVFVLLAAIAAFGCFGWMVIKWLRDWVEHRMKLDDANAEARMKTIAENTAMLRQVEAALDKVLTILKERL